MRKLHKKIAVFALLLILPLQGLAAALMPFACIPAPTHAAQQAIVADAQQDHGDGAAMPHQHDAYSSAKHHQDSDDGASGQNYNGHLCCHLFSAIPATEAVVAASDLPLLTSPIPVLVALFVPEQPQRPPRA